MIRTEKFYFAVVEYNGRLLVGTMNWRAKGAREAAIPYLPWSRDKTWDECRRVGFRVVKVAVSEYGP